MDHSKGLVAYERFNDHDFVESLLDCTSKKLTRELDKPVRVELIKNVNENVIRGLSAGIL